MNTQFKNPFKIERTRAYFAKKQEYFELKKTYNNNFEVIINLNTANFWDKKNKSYKVNKLNNPIAYHRFNIFMKYLDIEKNILNIGSGSGTLEEFISKTNQIGSNWHGIDIAKKSIKSLKSLYPKGNFKVANIQKLPYENKFFDYVVVSEVLEHIQPINTFNSLHEIRRVLKRNATLILSVPINEGLDSMIQKGVNPNAHVRVYTPALIRAELIISGFSVYKSILLYAFKKNYKIKSFVCKYIIPKYRKPNNIIIIAKKK